MIKATMGKEIIIKTLNDIGVVAEISKIVAQRGISIVAVSAWVEGAHGIIHLVTEDNQRAMDCLGEKFQPREAAVVVVEVAHKPGMLKSVTEKLKTEGIDIHHLYASTVSSAEKCMLVFSSANNDRALLSLASPPAKGSTS
jgi:hypothetical protein